MGTRTYSRRGVLTAAGRRRAELAAVDIFGNPIPSRTPAPVVQPAGTPRSSTVVNFVGDTEPIIKSQQALENIPVATELDYERVYVTDVNGNLLYENSGQQYTVQVNPDQNLPNRAQIMAQRAHATHNHPIVRPLSVNDALTMMNEQFTSVEARTKPMSPVQREFINAVYKIWMDNPDSFISASGDSEFNGHARTFISYLLQEPDAKNLTFTLAQDGIPNMATQARSVRSFSKYLQEAYAKMPDLNLAINLGATMWEVTTNGSAAIRGLSFNQQVEYMKDAIETLTQHVAFVRTVEKVNQIRPNNLLSYGMRILP